MKKGQFLSVLVVSLLAASAFAGTQEIIERKTLKCQGEASIEGVSKSLTFQLVGSCSFPDLTLSINAGPEVNLGSSSFNHQRSDGSGLTYMDFAFFSGDAQVRSMSSSLQQNKAAKPWKVDIRSSMFGGGYSSQIEVDGSVLGGKENEKMRIDTKCEVIERRKKSAMCG